jgi:hypothetical protein
MGGVQNSYLAAIKDGFDKVIFDFRLPFAAFVRSLAQIKCCEPASSCFYKT